jgi:peroxiredoxin
LGITIDPPEVARAAAARTKNMDYSLASDSGGRVSQAFLASQVPTVFVIDRRGLVADVMVGVSEPRVEEFLGLVEKLIETPG